jgi:dTDP-4-dehydrorhamnose 3,5-epimerase
VTIEQLGIEGAFTWTPKQIGDPRGLFLEWFKEPTFREAAGHELHLAQANMSVSARGTVRGIHFADVPPSQAKYVTCVAGAVLDVVVDIRVGSPTYGQWQGVRLDTVDRRAIYLSEGLGHAFCALEDGSTVVYLCSEGYAPTREHGVHPLDPAIGIEWGIPADELLLSEKDAAAPTLADAQESGLLPSYGTAREFRRSLR